MMVEETLLKIEENQKALRHSIEESKQLSARSDQLLNYARDSKKSPLRHDEPA